jgi:hypothetical protein
MKMPKRSGGNVTESSQEFHCFSDSYIAVQLTNDSDTSAVAYVSLFCTLITIVRDPHATFSEIVIYVATD